MARKNNKYSGRKLRTPDIRKVGGFTQIPNAFILNPEIGNPELRLLQYIMMYSDNRTIRTDNCIKYLGKTKQAIYPLFDKLIALGILKITDDIIEVIVPDEMKKYKLGYLKGQENLTTEVKKTLPTSQENLTTEVKKTYNKPLDDVDNDDDTNPIILYNNTRVLPVPATSGNTEQSHSNDNTKDNTGIELDLECDELQSQASPSVLAPSLHTPKQVVENGDSESSLPVGDYKSKPLPIDDNNSNSSPSNQFQIDSENHTSISERNDLNFVLENVPYFKIMYDNAKWDEIDISNFSNAYISHLTVENEKNNKDESISSKTYFFLQKLIQYSSILENDSNLWKEFQRQCKSEGKANIILKFTHKSVKNQI